MKDIKEIFSEFVKECSEKLNLYSIVQFGSSTHTEDFEDIDSLFISKDEVISVKDNLEMIRIVRDFENKYPEVVFDFGGVNTRDRNEKYSITIVLVGKSFLEVEHNPHDLFFLLLLSKDNSIKILFGENPFNKKKILLTKKHLFEMISVDSNRDMLRSSLDNQNKLNEGIYSFFKSCLRAMLIHKGHFEKRELLEEFEKEYAGKIELPKNSQEIIKHHIKKEDFEDMFRFSEECLKYLKK